MIGRRRAVAAAPPGEAGRRSPGGARAIAAALLAAVGAAACATTGGPHARRGQPLAAAELPHRVLRARGGGEVADAKFLDEVAGAQVVCVGEQHTNPHHHWAQWWILQQLLERAGEREHALGMEMFQRPVQGVLDDYVAGRIDAKQLVSRSGWEQRWGYDFDLYRPMVELAAARGLPILALNAPSEIVKKVARGGLEALTPDERNALPPLELGDERHRAFFREATEGHGHGHGGHGGPGGHEGQGGHGGGDGFENFYTAQVIWDETMADAAAGWLASAPAGVERRVVILAGTGHCHPTGIPSRLARRGVSAVSVLPVLDDGKGGVADELVSPGGDYLFVLDATAGR
jgi:uncharacterized iron-regulated protein